MSVAVVFRVAAGPRIGFGHLVRCRALAGALHVDPIVSLRGCAAARRAAENTGLLLRDGEPDALLNELQPAILIIDDPSRHASQPWVRAADRASVPVAAVHDSGIGAQSSDLVIDGSVAPGQPIKARWKLRGPRYSILAPSITTARRRGCHPVPGRILVALGGGADVHRLAPSLAVELARVVPAADLRIASGFVPRSVHARLPFGAWSECRGGLADELSSCEIAVVGGGVTLLEACALGVPTVAVAVTSRQQRAIQAAADAAAVIAAGSAMDADMPRRVAAVVAELNSTPARRHALSRAAMGLVDDAGASRVADAIWRFIDIRASATHAA